MANNRVISVNESSLVDLKAELYRKETQFKRDKVDSSLPKKAPIWQKKKKQPKKENTASGLEKLSANSSDSKEFERSRLMLEAKSTLYEKLSKGEIEVPSDEDEQDGRFLVDFHKKTISKENSSEHEDGNNTPVHLAVNAEEEWVDYVDSFGRSKKCLRKDLPLMKEKDESFKENKKKKNDTDGHDTSIPTLLSDDMRRELIRKKWEKEVEETLDKPVGPVHYQDVLFEETRDHGVAYYKFSRDEDERQEQQTLLKTLRTQTERQRNKQEKLLEKRKAAMDARLAKVRERKLKKLTQQVLVPNDQLQVITACSTSGNTTGNNENLPETTSSTQDKNELSVDNMVERIRNKTTRMEKAHLNQWEMNKIDLTLLDKPKPQAPKYDPHSERNPEFAPPPSYTTTESQSFEKRKWNHSMNEENIRMCESNETLEPQNRAATTTTSLCNNYRHETPVSRNLHQVPVCPNLPTSLAGSVLPNLPPPPTHVFPPPSFPIPLFPIQPSSASPYHPQFPPKSTNYNYCSNIPYPLLQPAAQPPQIHEEPHNRTPTETLPSSQLY